MKQIGKYLEATQVAAAFAEVDEHDTARQVISQAIDDMTVITRQSADEGVACHLSYGTGSTEKEISWFVDNHPDVILAICDTSGQKTGSSIDRSFDKIKQHLCVPVVKFDGRPSGKTAKPVL